MSIYISPVPGDEAQRDIAAGREWARDIRTERARDQFDAKDLFDHLGDDEARLMRLCEALLPLVAIHRSGRKAYLLEIAEAVEAIAEPVIKERAA